MTSEGAFRWRSVRGLKPWHAAALVALLVGFFVPFSVVQAQTGATTASTTRSVTEWLMRMHEASCERTYTGTLVVSVGSAMSASRIWHVCDGKQKMERIETLTGAPRTTLRRNNEVMTFFPESKTVWVEKRESLGLFPELLRTPSNLIPEFYGVRESGVARVAGYLADVVEIFPRDNLRFGYRIWAEQKTGLVIKLQTIGEHGAVLEQMAFSELQLDAPVRMDQLSRMMSDTKGYSVLRPALKKTTPEAEGWLLREAVPGFLPMSSHTQVQPESPAPATGAPMQWVFSDGLASVSLFVEAFDAQRHLQEQSLVTGATHSLTRRIGNHWLTVLGEVPPATLRRFAQAMERSR